MIVLTEDIKSVCNKILFAIDSQNSTQITESVEMYTEGTYLYLCVTNKEYFVKIKLNVYDEYEFHATVSAASFLKLISKMNSASIELTCDGNCLIVKGDGKYKIPTIFDSNGKMLTLPEIHMDQKTIEFDISNDIISSIPKYRYKFNNKQLKKMYSNTVQDMYYIDEDGCLTFTSGACINSFKLDKPCKFLLTDKIVKLFRLFKEEFAEFNLGHKLFNEITQTVISLKDSNIELTAILNDSSLINSVPATVIRKRATNVYPHNVVVNKDMFVKAIDRLMIFDPDIAGYFEFSTGYVDISNKIKTNVEKIEYVNNADTLTTSYKASLDLVDLKAVLDTIDDEFINIGFGDGQAFVIIMNNITYVIPEVVD